MFSLEAFDIRAEGPIFEMYAQFPRVDRKTAAMIILACIYTH